MEPTSNSHQRECRFTATALSITSFILFALGPLVKQGFTVLLRPLLEEWLGMSPYLIQLYIEEEIIKQLTLFSVSLGSPFLP
jgi:hypothetical protein